MGAQHGVGASTIAEWRKSVLGANRADWLPRLAPQRKGGGKEAEVDAGAWTYFLSDYLRFEEPTLASCYRRTLDNYCAPRGLTLPHIKTLQRKVERDVDPRVVIARRKGADALRATIPSQERTVADLHALEWVNIDGHRWDVFVKWPDGHVARPMMVAIQDIYSRKIVAWRVGETESAVRTRLAFADLFRDWGIPKGCLMDNGRAFASKWITGGTANRFRFKVRPEEPTGLLTSLGVQVRWALPFRGSSKPLERAFRDLCDSVAKHPAFAGAYTGNKPDAKPENYGSKAIELETFLKVARLGIAAHNAQLNRRTEACAGRSSFDQAFEASYVRSPIGKATPEQLRLALLAADKVSTDRKTGAISLYGNTYWSDAMSRLAGQRVVVRFDPDNLHSEIHVYGLDGAYLTPAALQAKTGFLDAEAAGRRARQEANLRKSTRQAAELLQLITAEQLAEMMPDLPDEAEDAPEPTIIRPVRTRGNALLKPAPAVAVAPEPTPETEDVTDKWARAMERASSHLRVVD
jgi:transposase InsO family protein